MVSLLSSLNMTANTLSVNEKAISVVSHNVANMNTEGYHKQRANLQTRNIAGAIGNTVYNQVRANGGVKIANILRYNDEYLQNYYRNQNSDLNKLAEQLEGLGDLADVLNDLDGKGINKALADFYEALNNLNEYPASSTARINFIETAKTLTSTMNAKYSQLAQNTTAALGDGETEESLKNSKIYMQYTALNDKLGQLAEVNKALQVTQTGTLEANNLLDQRDIILDEISQFTNISVEEKANGTVNVYVGNTALVKGSVVKGELKLQTAKDFLRQKYPGKTEEELKAALDDWFENGGENAVVTLVNPENNTISVDNANSLFTSGTLGGLIHFATDTGAGENGINAGTVMKGLNTLAQTIADVFNDLNTRDGAYCIDSKNTGHLLDATIDPTLIFVGADGTTAGKVTAGNIQVNSELFADNGCWKLSCAYFKDDDNFDINAVGNSQNVVSMLGTRNSQLTDSDGNLLYDKDGNLLLNGMSIEDYYTSIVGKVATAGSNIKSLYNTQNEVVESIKNKIDSQTGVDLNEELVDLVKYQTAYAAAAQVFNACNSCLNTLMALGG